VCVDHHRGSEEQQPGEQYHDPELFDADAGRLDTLGALRRTLRIAGLEGDTIVIVTTSVRAASTWGAPLGLVFIDGGHSHATANADYDAWSEKVAPGGILAIHDVFFDANEGGQAPREIYERALASGRYDKLPMTKTLGVLRRV
jgi:predicted O-methyltransferase YrrM